MSQNLRRARGRFAPTPSGELHIGNAWTALLSWLQIRSADGTFILRMEDIDTQRSKPHLAKQILDDLHWLGLDWDEGPDIGGPLGPYTQSERMEYYDEALKRLQENGYLFRCFCSRADLLAAASAPHGLSSEGPAYPGTCRNLTDEEADRKSLVKEPSLRFKVRHEQLVFHDGVAGTQTFDAAAGGDFIVRRADRMISYQLAVVVDDHMMGITDVLRGADLLDSVPRQLLLYKALGMEAPSFAHVPLFMGPDGKRLAKRHGGTSLAALRERQTAPERLVGWLMWLAGFTPNPEPLTARECIPLFRMDKLPSEPIVITGEMLSRLHGAS
ncbi:tRNA glutamyl-Q(34) synthetase GluQRS [Paenibacillus cookii]|uniref:Glutamyl-Q tRNA(Asp) synthetase n=1 Tax=Paenibacillus cookii TaxID=157839 RepID=A0ABQ4LUJ5_9BACL|nr:tRNA glutamyl-Q(34) synthetase GluQRS [Paenibacillus cookii]KHF37190.1 Glutamate--tRNA ligase 1 [Paenibacillus sp. P1XP2]GIO66957.1 glutamyl-Q tRNA(Asp) synthetase [Paenibacillus cookii]